MNLLKQSDAALYYVSLPVISVFLGFMSCPIIERMS